MPTSYRDEPVEIEATAAISPGPPCTNLTAGRARSVTNDDEYQRYIHNIIYQLSALYSQPSLIDLARPTPEARRAAHSDPLHEVAEVRTLLLQCKHGQQFNKIVRKYR